LCRTRAAGCHVGFELLKIHWVNGPLDRWLEKESIRKARGKDLA
jgi:hypothetical protein